MNRLKGRMLAGVLAAVTLFSSVTPGTVRAAEPSEADTSVEAFSVAEESEPESTEGLEETDTTSDESSGEGAAETTAAEEDEEEDAAGKALEDGQEGGQTDENAEEADDSEPGSGEGTTQTVLSESGVEDGQEDRGETAAPAAEEEKDPEMGKEETKAGRVAIRFDSEGGIVKVIISSDNGASEEEPSYTLEKQESGRIRVTERGGATYYASMADEGYVLDLEEEAGTDITVVADAAEGFHISRYSVSSDAGGEEEMAAASMASRFANTKTISVDGLTVFSIGFEKDESETGTVAVKVGSAGGKVSIVCDDEEYELKVSEDGTVEATDKEGRAVASADKSFDIVLEKEIGKNILIKAAADKGSHVTAFAVTDKDGKTLGTEFKKGEEPEEYEQEIVVSEGQKSVNISFVDMPEFEAEQKVGRVIVKVKAERGVLPEGTTFKAVDIFDEEHLDVIANALVSDDVYPKAAVDITFYDKSGKEIQPNGMVQVSFEDYNESFIDYTDDTVVVHVTDEGKAEEIESEKKDNTVVVENNEFSPYVLLGYSDDKSRVPSPSSDNGSFTGKESEPSYVIFGSTTYHDYTYHESTSTEDDYWEIKLGHTTTLSVEDSNGNKGTAVCVDPYMSGAEHWENKKKTHVVKVTSANILKALYYGQYDTSKINSITGSSSKRDKWTLVHYAVCYYTKANGLISGSDFVNGPTSYSTSQGRDLAPYEAFWVFTSERLRNDVADYMSFIESAPVPNGYTAYIVYPSDDRSPHGSQSYVYLVKDQMVSINLVKSSANTTVTSGNNCYSLAGGVFGVYSDAACKTQVGTLTTKADGSTNTLNNLKPGTYYAKELEAPKGYLKDTTVQRVTATSPGKTYTFKVTDEPGNDPIVISIKKKSADTEAKNSNSLKGTEFTVRYYDGYYKAGSIPSKATRTWVIQAIETNGVFASGLSDTYKVSGDDFYKKGKNTVLPLGTVTIQETKAAKGYVNDGKFGGAEMYIGQVRLNSAGTDTELVDIQGKRTTSNSFEVTDTPEKPEIKTTAVDKASGTHTAFAGGEITVVDTVSYKNLIVNNEYTLKGRLMDKKTGEPVKDIEGREVTAETKFTAKTIDGSVNMSFTFKTDSSFAGKSIVAFETVEFEGKEVAVHADINDENQTVHFPKIGTTAVNPDTKDHILKAGKNAVVKDTVYYENLVPGNEYSVRGTLMLKPDNKPLLVDGKEVTAEKTFRPEGADGQVDVVFTFDATGLDNKDLVVFEEVYVGNSLIGEHKDLNDKEQTVHFPGVETDAYDKDTEKKNTLAAEDKVIVDRITYKNLIPGKTYEISGEVKIKSADAAGFDEAETVPSQIVGVRGEGELSFDPEKVTFVPAGNDSKTVSGELFVSFKVNAADLAGEEIVVGETVRYRGFEIAVHRDIEDDRQNDFIPKGKTVSVDTETGIKNTLAAENRIFKDTFSYEKLIPGETYRFTGKVMAESGTDEEGNTVLEEIPSVMTDEKGVPVEKGFIEFVPEKQDGELDLYFSIDATTLENRDVTVFEKVTLNGEPVIIHEVLDGTQTVYVPEGRTQVVDSETKDQIAMPDEEVTVIDTLVYKNLIPGTTYTVKGRVMRKKDASEVPSMLTEASFKTAQEGEGQEGPTGTISVADNVVTFTPDQEDGALELTFVFNGSELKGEDTVIFERVYHNGAEVIVHENIDDEPQTVHLPDGRTEAADPDTDDRTMMAGGDVTIRDRFYYENLIPGDEYVIHGKVILKPENGKEAQVLDARMVDADGNEVEEWVFTPAEKDGSEDIFFVINSDGLAGRSVVMFETLEFINPELETRTLIVVHEDMEDEDQTVHFPDGRTTALDSDTRSHTANADEEVTILDEVKFINLIPGKMYKVTGTLMDKETGREVFADGRVLTSTKEFVPVTSDGSVIVEFTFNGADLAGRSVVAFEKVLSNGKEVFVHADLEDEDQKVDFPEIRTSAVDKKDGDREISYKGTVRIADTVTYKNLMPGTRYHVTGVLMNKSSGQPATSGGKEITGETVFTADQKDGSVEVVLSFNSSDLDDGEYVVFETVYEISAEIGDENVVGRHADINDQAQTVKRRTPPGTPKTGDDSSTLLWLAALGASAAGIAVAVFFRKRRTGR